MANSLTKRSRVDFFVEQTKNLATKMEEYFFKDNSSNHGGDANAKKILEILKENAKLCNSGFPSLGQLDKLIFMLIEQLRVVNATLSRINNGDEEVKELCNSAGIRN